MNMRVWHPNLCAHAYAYTYMAHSQKCVWILTHSATCKINETTLGRMFSSKLVPEAVENR
jgi:hypothetical protein